MTKLEEFKAFIKTKPELINYVENGEMTWQKFYEIYDIYGTEAKVWDKYKGEDRALPGVSEGISKISNIVKNMDMESIKSHINTAQKAIDFMADLTTKKSINPTQFGNNLNKGPLNPRPLNKFFED